MRAYLEILALRRYRLLWIGDTLSSLGDSIALVALIWLVYSTAGSPATLGGFLAVYTAPVIVGGPLAGIALDTLDRRRLMIADNVFGAGSSGCCGRRCRRRRRWARLRRRRSCTPGAYASQPSASVPCSSFLLLSPPPRVR